MVFMATFTISGKSGDWENVYISERAIDAALSKICMPMFYSICNSNKILEK